MNIYNLDNVIQNSKQVPVTIKTKVNSFTFGKTEEELSQEEAAAIRTKRDYLINEVQWRVDRYLEQKAAGETTVDTEAKFKKISAYVKALRDIPAQKGFPFEVTWPTLEV